MSAAKYPVRASKLAQAVYGNAGAKSDRWVFVFTMDEVTQPAMVADGRRAHVTLTPGELATGLGKIPLHQLSTGELAALRTTLGALRRIDEERLS